MITSINKLVIIGENINQLIKFLWNVTIDSSWEEIWIFLMILRKLDRTRFRRGIEKKSDYAEILFRYAKMNVL